MRKPRSRPGRSIPSSKTEGADEAAQFTAGKAVLQIGAFEGIEAGAIGGDHRGGEQGIEGELDGFGGGVDGVGCAIGEEGEKLGMLTPPGKKRRSGRGRRRRFGAKSGGHRKGDRGGADKMEMAGMARRGVVVLGDGGEGVADEGFEVGGGIGEGAGGGDPAWRGGAQKMEGVLKATKEVQVIATKDAGERVGLVEDDQTGAGEGSAEGALGDAAEQPRVEDIRSEEGDLGGGAGGEGLVAREEGGTLVTGLGEAGLNEGVLPLGGSFAGESLAGVEREHERAGLLGEEGGGGGGGAAGQSEGGGMLPAELGEEGGGRGGESGGSVGGGVLHVGKRGRAGAAGRLIGYPRRSGRGGLAAGLVGTGPAETLWR